MKNLFMLFVLLFSSSQSFAGIDSVVIVAKLKSINGQNAMIEYQGKAYQILKKDIKNMKSAISGNNVEILLSPEDFDFLLKH